MNSSEVPDQLLEYHLPSLPVLKSQEFLISWANKSKLKKHKGRLTDIENRLVVANGVGLGEARTGSL